MKREPQQRRPHSAPWTPEKSERADAQTAIGQARRESRPALRRFAVWLESERGLALGSITVRIASARRFVDWVNGRSGATSQAFRALTPGRIERFFVSYGGDHGPAALRSMQAATRLFLRFTSSIRWTSSDLVDAVPSLRSYRLSEVPRGINSQDLSRMLASLDRCCARDRAIAHLLTSYGVRRQQISTLCLGDIDWTQRTVMFAAHKGGKAVRHAMTPVVASSLATYLRHERPTVESDAVFLRRKRPHLRVSPCCVAETMRTLMRRAGLQAKGPHALRHAFATRLLATGESMKSIADLLGHQSLSSVAIYAKVDHRRLLEVAGEWPEVVS